MAKHIRLGNPRFAIEFKSSKRASVHAGQLVVRALLEEFGLWQRVREEEALDTRLQSGKGYDPEVLVAQLLFCFTSGGVSFSDAERLAEDEALKALLGTEQFADQATLAEWLRQIGTPGWQALRRIGRDFVQWALARVNPALYQQGGRTECFFDDTQVEVSGHQFEGAKLNYEGNLALSWQMLWVGPFLADSLLGTTSLTKESPSSEAAGQDVSACLPELLAANRHLWRKEHSYLYTDSASSAGKYLELIGRHFEAWSVSYNKWTSPLERKAAELPELAWSPEQKTQWQDGTEHIAQYGWIRYQPGGCEQGQLFAVVRHKRAQGELFWRYAFVVCQAQAKDPRLVFEHHRLKGDRERVLSELLRDLDLHHPPCKDLRANRSFYTLASLAYNVLQALKLLHLPAEDQPKRVRTLIRHLLLVPVEIKRHARQMKACLFVPSGWLAWWRGFLREFLPHCRQLGAVLGSG
jgi:hypothetical protein